MSSSPTYSILKISFSALCFQILSSCPICESHAFLCLCLCRFLVCYVCMCTVFFLSLDWRIPSSLLFVSVDFSVCFRSVGLSDCCWGLQCFPSARVVICCRSFVCVYFVFCHVLFVIVVYRSSSLFCFLVCGCLWLYEGHCPSLSYVFLSSSVLSTTDSLCPFSIRDFGDFLYVSPRAFFCMFLCVVICVLVGFLRAVFLLLVAFPVPAYCLHDLDLHDYAALFECFYCMFIGLSSCVWSP